MGNQTPPAQSGAGRKRSKDELFKLADAVLHKKPGTIEVEVQPGQVREIITEVVKQKKSQRFKITQTKRAERPDFRLSINGVSVVKTGGIDVVCGQAKSGKTQFLMAMTAVMMSGRPFGSMKREAPPQTIAWFDTEQDLDEVLDCRARLFNLAGIPEETPSEEVGLHIYGLAEAEDYYERVEVVQEVIDDLDPDVIIIDGAVDLLDDFNDVSQSKELVERLMKNKAGRNIFVVIHTNEGTNKMRGHLGTELKNKCSDIFTCSLKGEADNEKFEVKHMSRRRHFPGTFTFKFDKGFESLVPVDDFNTDTQDPGIAGDPDKALEAIFEGGKRMLFAQVRNEFAKRVGISQKEAGEYIKQHYIGTRLLQDNEGLWYLAFFKFS